MQAPAPGDRLGVSLLLHTPCRISTAGYASASATTGASAEVAAPAQVPVEVEKIEGIDFASLSAVVRMEPAQQPDEIETSSQQEMPVQTGVEVSFTEDSAEDFARGT